MLYFNFVKYTLFSRVLTLFIGLISHILCTQEMGPKLYGIALLILVFQPIAIKFMNLGVAGSLTYFINKDPDNKQIYIGNGLFFCIFIMIPIMLILFLSLDSILSKYSSLVQYKNYLVYIFILSPIYVFHFFVRNLLKALNYIKTLNNLNILFQSIFNFISYLLLAIFY